MNKTQSASTEHEGKEDRLEKFKNAINDAKHVLATYKDKHPDEAWECLHKIIFNPALK